MRVYSYIHQTLSALLLVAALVLAIIAFSSGQAIVGTSFVLSMLTAGFNIWIPVMWRKVW